MAWRVTIRCCAPLGMAVRVARGPRRGCTLVGSSSRCRPRAVCPGITGIGSIKIGDGLIPGVLLRVVRRWSRGVARKSRLAVGLRVSAMGWASVSRGIVMMGDSSITLCSSSRAARCCSMVTLCVSETGGGSRISSMRAPRSLRSRRPLSVVPATAVCSVSSSVNARKCWCGVRDGN